MFANRFFISLAASLKRLSWPASLAVGLLLLLGCAVLDWVTPPQMALSIVYLLPISWLTWKGGRSAGLAMALIAGVTWTFIDLATNGLFQGETFHLWNGLVRVGFFLLVSGMQAEVIDRKRAERQLRLTNESLQKQTAVLTSILDSMGDGVLVVDSQRRPLHINPAAKRILQLSSTDSDRSVSLPLPLSGSAEAMALRSGGEDPLTSALRGQAVDGLELLLQKDGRPQGTWLLVSARPLLDSAGKITGGVLVFSDISARKELERQIATVSEREKRAVGEDLHDGLCQHLVSTALAARTLAARLSDRSVPEAEDAVEIAELLGQSIAQARTVARGLYLVPLEAGGLAAALEEFAAQAGSRHHVACRFVDDVAVPITGELVVTNLFRIAQEAVNNALKHARARQITVTLSADEEQIRLQVEDDGVGFGSEPPGGRGMGLHIMGYRARMMGAVLQVGPRPGGGTLLTCSLRRSAALEQEPHVAQN